MPIYETIRSRRSIRKYKKELPSEKHITDILEAGRWAPSGLNNQPWRFKVLADKAQKDGLAEFTEYGDVIKSAPAAICVFLDKEASYNRQKDIMAVGACIQNMLLQAEESGLAACWLGEILNKKDDVSSYLSTGKKLKLMAVITLGYSAESAESERKPLKELML
jgi:nitroreductase